MSRPAITFANSRAGSRRPVAVVTTGKFSLGPDARPEVDNIVLSLPMPPTTNHLYATAENGGRFKSQEYNDWLAEAGWRVQAQRPGRIAGPYEIEAVFARPSRRCDLDNRFKPLSDLLVKQRVVQDDHLAEKITLAWAPAGEGVLVTLTKHQPTESAR